jgi:hypothetical protein
MKVALNVKSGWSEQKVSAAHKPVVDAGNRVFDTLCLVPLAPVKLLARLSTVRSEFARPTLLQFRRRECDSNRRCRLPLTRRACLQTETHSSVPAEAPDRNGAGASGPVAAIPLPQQDAQGREVGDGIISAYTSTVSDGPQPCKRRRPQEPACTHRCRYQARANLSTRSAEVQARRQKPGRVEPHWTHCFKTGERIVGDIVLAQPISSIG